MFHVKHWRPEGREAGCLHSRAVWIEAWIYLAVASLRDATADVGSASGAPSFARGRDMSVPDACSWRPWCGCVLFDPAHSGKSAPRARAHRRPGPVGHCVLKVSGHVPRVERSDDCAADRLFVVVGSLRHTVFASRQAGVGRDATSSQDSHRRGQERCGAVAPPRHP